MRLVVFGAGNAGRRLCNAVKADINNADIVVCIVDNDTNKWDEEIDSIRIISPSYIGKYEYDMIVVCGIYCKDISKQLINMGFKKDLIISDIQYMRCIFAKKEYMKRGYESKNNIKTISERIIVYSAIMGKYDELMEPEYSSDMLDYVCFTNDKGVRSEKWNIEYVTDLTMDDMHLAKRIKLFPEKYFEQYRISVWIDGKYKIKGNFIEYISEYIRDSGILLFPHPERNCIYSEAAECIHLGKGKKEDIIKQITSYHNEGYPFDNGLYECGCIVRCHNSKKIQNIMSQWWKQICSFSYRDQISLPYVCWKNNFLPDICDMNINDNKFIEVVHPH